jgi:succinate-acetate transporter protein
MANLYKMLLICTLRSTVALFLLLFALDLSLLFLTCQSYASDLGDTEVALQLKKTGGFFGFLAALTAWYNALAVIQDSRYHQIIDTFMQGIMSYSCVQ